MRRFLSVVLALCCASPILVGQEAPSKNNPFKVHGRVGVSKDGTHLAHADGTPFFWLADTVWNGPLLSTKDDWARYLDDRKAKKFTVVQFNVLAPWRTAPADHKGRVAFKGTKDVTIDEEFFRNIDERIDMANERGLLVCPVLLWALAKTDPGNVLSEADCIRLAQYQVKRWQDRHVVWCLVGDNPYGKEQGERWKRVGRAVFGDGMHAPVVTHPTGMNWPWESWKDERWLTVLGYQSGHGDNAAAAAWIHSGPVARTKINKPIINLEPPYEKHNGYQSRKPHSAYSVRRAVYWSLLNAPTAGVTYGAHGIWSWQTEDGKEPRNHAGTGIAPRWDEALDLPGATHMKHMAELFTALPWQDLRPTPDLMTSQPGGTDPLKFVAASATTDGDCAVLYLPVGGAVELRPCRLAKLKAEWFDPRTGQRSPALARQRVFTAPDAQDWVLLLKDR